MWMSCMIIRAMLNSENTNSLKCFSNVITVSEDDGSEQIKQLKVRKHDEGHAG